MKGRVMTTTSSPTDQAAALACIIELHLPCGEAPDRPDRYYWGAQCCPHHGRDRPACYRPSDSRSSPPSSAMSSTALTASWDGSGDMDIEEVNRLAEQIVRELS